MNILEKAIKNIFDKKMLEKNDKVIIGCSGGADSIFLLNVLLAIKKEYNLEIYPVHINHLFRGAEAQRDEDFVREYGASKNLKVFVKRKSMKDMAKEEKITLEEAGREIRYSFFDEVMKLTGSTKIALAHNLDDQIETFLFRLIRGSSLEGLEGISDTRDDGKYIRPINEIYKSDIVAYLEENNIPYMVDSTNLENEYTRNSIRLDLIPFIEKRYNPKFKEKIHLLLKEIREVNNIIEPDYSYYIIDNTMSAEKLSSEKSDYIRGKIINYYLAKNNIEPSRKKIQGIINILSTGGSKKIKLDKSCTLVKEYDKIFIIKDKISEKIGEAKLCVPGEVEFGEYIISATLETKNTHTQIKGNDGFLTNLKKDTELLVRSRIEGDKILPIGMNSYKKLKNIMIDDKIPKEERDRVPIILCNDEIVWVAGVRKSKNFVPQDFVLEKDILEESKEKKETEKESKKEFVVLRIRRKNSV